MPPNRAEPLSALSRPRRILRVELLPAPLGPRNAVTSPGAAVKPTP